MIAYRKDLPAGAIFIAFGLFYGYQSFAKMPVGTVTRMGPGFFPLILSAALVLFGVAIALRSFFQSDEGSFGAVPWRAIALISAATILFAMFADDLGMLPITFLTGAVAALAKKETTLLQAVLLGVCVALFCSLIFTIGLGLPLPIFGTLFTG